MGEPYERLGARAPLSITSGGVFQLGGVQRSSALLVSAEGVLAWPLPRPAIDEEALLRFLDAHEGTRGDFVLLGTGAALVFPSPAFRAGIDRRNLGLEVMDTNAACRTYNVLIAEGRMFTAALLPLASVPVSP
jgi:uncharacterized protein